MLKVRATRPAESPWLTPDLHSNLQFQPVRLKTPTDNIENSNEVCNCTAEDPCQAKMELSWIHMCTGVRTLATLCSIVLLHLAQDTNAKSLLEQLACSFNNTNPRMHCSVRTGSSLKDVIIIAELVYCCYFIFPMYHSLRERGYNWNSNQKAGKNKRGHISCLLRFY